MENSQKIITEKLKDINISDASMQTINKFTNDLMLGVDWSYIKSYEYKGINANVRKSRGLSVEDLIELCDIKMCKKTINNYENGKTDLSVKKLLSIAKALRTSPEVLLGLEMTPLQSAQNNKIVKYKHHFTLNEYKDDKDKYFFFDEGLVRKENDIKVKNTAYELVALDLQEDSSLLHVPKGTTLIVDRTFDDLNDNPDTPKKVLLQVNQKFYPTKLFYVGTSRNKNLYSYENIDGNLIQVNKKEIFNNPLFFGLIKKAVLDY